MPSSPRITGKKEKKFSYGEMKQILDVVSKYLKKSYEEGVEIHGMFLLRDLEMKVLQMRERDAAIEKFRELREYISNQWKEESDV